MNDEQSKEKLTDKQAAFCQFYLSNGFNGTQAAISAGYSEDSANVIASENLTKPYIRNYIDSLIRQRMGNEWEETRIKVIQNLMDIAYDDNNREETRNRDGELVMVSRRDRLKALELLGKYGSLFNENINIKASVATKETPIDPNKLDDETKAKIAQAYVQSIEEKKNNAI